jgi:hypothetical protein
MRGINSGHPAFGGTSGWVPFLLVRFLCTLKGIKSSKENEQTYITIMPDPANFSGSSAQCGGFIKKGETPLWQVIFRRK